MRKIAGWGIVAVVLLAAIGGYYFSRGRQHSFPGQFVVGGKPDYLFRVDASGTTRLRMPYMPREEFLAQSGTTWNGNLNGLRISPDGQSACYLKCDGDTGAVRDLLVRRIGRPYVANNDPQGYPMGPDTCEELGIIDVSKYGFSSWSASNIAWSPDGRRAALADATRLLIVDIESKQVRIGDLPIDDDSVKMYKHWQKHASEPIPDRIQRQTQLDNATQKYFLDKGKLSDEDAKIVRDGTERVRSALGIPSTTNLAVQTHWGEQPTRVNVDGKRKWVRLYNGGRRNLTWTSNDTIYCDNWVLKITGQSDTAIQLAATKTPLVSAYETCPCWSPPGDRAFYLIRLSGPTDTNFTTVKMLIMVVDAQGKHLWQTTVGAYPGKIRWSRDGRYLAVEQLSDEYVKNFQSLQRDSEPEWSFSIYEIGTGKVWQVPLTGDLKQSPNMYPDAAGWDWRM